MPYTIFLDRDGVINRDSPDYIKRPSEFHLLPNSAEAVALLNQNGFYPILVTNQSVIERKMVTPEGLDAIFNTMKKALAEAGGRLTDIFFCPHRPDQDCSCRKPKPGLILQAAQKHTVNLAESCMVGDSAKDIECGKNAGCGLTILVKTGNGIEAAKDLTQKGITPDYIADDLMDAARWISSNLTSG